MRTEHKPCPFCGATDAHLSSNGIENNFVTCSCGAEGPPAETDTDAIAAWNRRTPAEAAHVASVVQPESTDQHLAAQAMALMYRLGTTRLTWGDMAALSQRAASPVAPGSNGTEYVAGTVETAGVPATDANPPKDAAGCCNKTRAQPCDECPHGVREVSRG